MPSLLPLAISLVAWSSTSDGPLVKMLFLLRQGFGGQARCGSVLEHICNKPVLKICFGFWGVLLFVMFFGGQMTPIILFKRL